MDEFAGCVSEYRKFAALNEYDLQCMIPLFYDQIAALIIMGSITYLQRGTAIYIHQVIFSTKLLRWLEKDSAAVKPLASS